MENKKTYTLTDFNFELPEKLIAQYPEIRREGSRLFVLDRNKQSFEDRLFYQLPGLLVPGDLLVFNDTRVIPARVMFRRATGAVVEIILARRIDSRKWLMICNRTRRLKPGEMLISIADSAVTITVLSRVNEYLEIESNMEFHESLLKRIGMVPLPPYIKREFSDLDEERYQTVYARANGAVAAPTAGLHFSKDLLREISEMGVQIAYVTLHVSWGTFQPVRHEDLSLHQMHSERYIFPEESAESVNRARKEGRRVIAVGTTALRVLESTIESGVNRAGEGETSLFIHPPQKIESIDALITNFHTPCSTLLMLTAAFAGHERIMKAYSAAVQKEYRFFSYGDAMMIV